MQSTWWCFTLFYYFSEDIDFLLDELDSRGIVFQEELCPDTQQPHLQGTLRLRHARQMKAVKKLFGESRKHVHLEATRTPAASVAYCRKDDSLFGERYEQGDLKISQGQRNDILLLRDGLKRGSSMEQVANDHPAHLIRYPAGVTKMKFIFDKILSLPYRQVEVCVLYGLTGVRKTGVAIDLFGSSMLRLTREKSGSALWFDGYDDGETLLIDEFNFAWIPYDMLLGLLEGHQTRLPLKGGFTWARWRRVVITTNTHPANWFKCFPAGVPIALARRLTRVLRIDSAADAANIMPTLTGYGPLLEPCTWLKIDGVDYEAHPELRPHSDEYNRLHATQNDDMDM